MQARFLPVVGVALALCVAAWWLQTPVAAQKVTNAGKWEYKVLTVKRDKQGVFPIDEKSLNDLGNDGERIRPKSLQYKENSIRDC